MRGMICTALLVVLAGCAREDSGAAAARMEMQDDAACRQITAGKGETSYTQCRRNIFAYRQQAQVEEAQQHERLRDFGDSLQQAGAALQNIR